METREDVYLETVWASFSDGLRSKLVAAFGNNRNDTGREVVVDSLSKEEMGEIDWLTGDASSGSGKLFSVVTLKREGKKPGPPRTGVRLNSPIRDFIEDRVLI